MLTWLKRIVGPQKLKESFLVQSIPESGLAEKFTGLERQITDLEQAINGLTKISRRIHLSSDQNGSLLKDIQSELKTQSRSVVEENNDRYMFSESELLALLDLTTTPSLSPPIRHIQEITQLLLNKAGWRLVAEMNKPYHPTDCEIVEASFDPGVAGLVRHVIQQGYRDEQKQLIRRAKVIVTKASDAGIMESSPLEHFNIQEPL